MNDDDVLSNLKENPKLVQKLTISPFDIFGVLCIIKKTKTQYLLGFIFKVCFQRYFNFETLVALAR